MARKKTARRFEASEPIIYRDLRVTIIKLGGTTLNVNYDLLGHDPAARIIFDRAGKRYLSHCNRWPHFLDNLRAAQLAIEYTYRIGEAYGVNYMELKDQDLFDRIFAALEAPLDPDLFLLGSGDEWWGVLGLSRSASKAEIINAYRALAKVHHPDAGGRAEDFQRLRAAYEQGVKEKEL